MIASSVVPGLTNITSTPSLARSCKKAARPVSGGCVVRAGTGRGSFMARAPGRIGEASVYRDWRIGAPSRPIDTEVLGPYADLLEVASIQGASRWKHNS